MAKPNSKRKTRSDKFPLTLHPTGQFCKKIKGKLHYFGTDKQQALQRYLEQAADLHAGRRPKSNSSGRFTLKTLCNLYLEHQEARVLAGEIKLRQLYDQTLLLRGFVKYFGPNQMVSDVSTVDLQNFRAALIKKGKSTNNYISAIKAMYNWAADNEVIDTIPNLKAIKKVPKTKGKKPILTPTQIKKLLEYANPQMKAMIWMGLNCGFGCTDCAELLWENLDLNTGRVNFARTKTGMGRNLPLWKETVKCLKAIPRINKRVLNTNQGDKWVCVKQKRATDGTIKLISYNGISTEFSKLLKKAGIKTEKGTGFYTLRRTAATLAAKSGDPFAVQRLLGHADLRMATTYVQDISEQTDRVINNSRQFIIQGNS